MSIGNQVAVQGRVWADNTHSTRVIERMEKALYSCNTLGLAWEYECSCNWWFNSDGVWEWFGEY